MNQAFIDLSTIEFITLKFIFACTRVTIVVAIGISIAVIIRAACTVLTITLACKATNVICTRGINDTIISIVSIFFNVNGYLSTIGGTVIVFVSSFV